MLDLAAACYLLLGVSLTITAIALFFNDRFGWTAAGSYLYWIGAIALFVGLGCSLALWQHTFIRYLLVLAVLFLVQGLLYDHVPAAILNAVGTLIGLAMTVIALRWFLVLRPTFG